MERERDLAEMAEKSTGFPADKRPRVAPLASIDNVAHQTNGSGETPSVKEVPLPARIPKQFGDALTPYEKKEIESYPEVFYAGQNCKNKVKAPTSGCNDGYDTESGEYIVMEGDHIAYRYEILCHLGSGAFGQVLKATDHATGATVAVKLIRNKKKIAHQARNEVRMLEHIKAKDPDGKYNIVQMIDTFTFRSHICIVYELLGINMYDHMEKTEFYPMALGSVRKVAARMLVALTFLWKENIIHCDLKPENILYKTDASSDVIKVADLGSACYDSSRSYTYFQSRFYRAPEVVLGLPYGRPIDLWSFGCILCELATGYPLFPGENEKDQLACMMEYLGNPPCDMIRSSIKRQVYFDENLEPKIAPNSKGHVRTPGNKTLSTFLGLGPEDPFVDFLHQFLRWDPGARVPPRQAMRHPWIEEEFVFPVPKPSTSVVSRGEEAGKTSVTAAAAAEKPPPVAASEENKTLENSEAARGTILAQDASGYSQDTSTTRGAAESQDAFKTVPQTSVDSATGRDRPEGSATLSLPRGSTFQAKGSGDELSNPKRSNSSPRSLITVDCNSPHASATTSTQQLRLSAPVNKRSFGLGSSGDVGSSEVKQQPEGLVRQALPARRRPSLSSRAVDETTRTTSSSTAANGAAVTPRRQSSLRSAELSSLRRPSLIASGTISNRQASANPCTGNDALLVDASTGKRVSLSALTSTPAGGNSGSENTTVPAGNVANFINRFGGGLRSSRDGAATSAGGKPPTAHNGVTRGERAKTATLAEEQVKNGALVSSTAGRRQTSGGLPSISLNGSQTLAPVSVVSHSNTNPESSRAVASDKASGRSTSSLSSRRQEYSQQRQQRRTRQPEVAAVPEPCGGTLQTCFPRI